MLFGEAAMRLCRAAATLLGWRPDEFWRSTPAELAACLEREGVAGDPTTGDELKELMRRFPDR